MSVEIRVPEFGESVAEAVVGRWLKKEGETVGLDEALVELETDKVAMELTPEQAGLQEAGVLERIVQQEGATVGVGDVLATLTLGDGSASGNGATATAGSGNGASAPAPVPAP